MSEETLLIIFIGLVAVSWFAIAVVVAAVGWRMYRILTEVEVLATKARHAGALLGSWFEGIGTIVSKVRKRPPRKKHVTEVEVETE